ncbi:hypothetical protein GBA65_12360 [Rubrobacter marinus]|uniref:Uncharacterized protein n=1 Tax=Rubrobacter marinus TaxID=2653852 RepID=A0A6G8PY97_9ACTN|nr:hypothetical protein [Rubrobacter marinus]QIN79181.1 hypothetical protein GBA65_12360 [Rubrobacter marinus]
MRYFQRDAGALTGGSGGRAALLRFLVLFAAVALAGVAILSTRSDAQSGPDGAASAYNDPDKPVLSYLLSEPENVEEFRAEFGLSDAQVREVLARTRAENRTLAGVYAESERILAGSRGLSTAEKRERISASGYSGKVRRVVGGTKRSVEATLPNGRADELEAWVEEQWRDEVREAGANTAGSERGTRATRPPGTYRIFATQYIGYTTFEVAMPHRKLKFAGGYRTTLTLNGRRVSAPIKEVGPWNTYDNWWDPVAKRTMWKDLPRGKPEARAAFFENYNRGKDEFGREVLNPAGIDLTPAVARRLGLAKYENAYVYVSLPKRPAS